MGWAAAAASNLDMGVSDDLSRRALEALALQAFQSGRITKPELRRLLGFGARYRLDGFLKSHGVYEDYTMKDFEQDRDALRQMGL
jgi:hypothetical protein